MKSRSYNYYKLKSTNLPASCQYSFTSLDELRRFTEAASSKDIFILTDTDDNAGSFAIIQNGVMLHHPSLGYKNLEDFQSAKQSKFPDALTYYEAVLAGYHAYEDYNLVKEAGINDKAVFEKLKQQGYLSGFKDYLTIMAAGNDLPQTEPFSSAFDLFNYADKNEFENYCDFKEAFTKGFTNKLIYNVALQQGYTNFKDYEEGKRRCLRSYKELVFANENHIRDNDDFKQMIDLSQVTCEDCTFDNKVLLSLLSMLEPGKKASINKLNELFQKELDKYRYADTNEMPGWFTFSFNGNQSIIDFLQNNKEVKKYGSYDNDGEFFQLNWAKDRRVVIDCSNVAYNSNGNGKAKPYAANVIRLIEFLKKRGFNDLYLIADASLKHNITDTENMAALKQAAEYMEAPGGTSADAFIIDFVKKHNCKYITNDTFREWKVKDVWLANNYSFYHRSYIMNDHEVLIPGLD